MTELRQQQIQAYTDQALARQRYRDNEIPCAAIRKDPDGGLQCTQRGLAQDAPKLFYGFDAAAIQVITADFEDLNIDTVGFVNDDGTVFSLSGDELEILKTGDVEIEVKATVQTTDPGRWDFEIVISEDNGGGHAQDPTTISNGGRGEIAGLEFLDVSADHFIQPGDEVIRCDASSGIITVTLPTAAVKRRVLRVKKIDSSANVVRLAGLPPDLIDGLATQTLSSQWDTMTVIAVGTGWSVL